MQNKYYYRSRISEKQFREIIRLFCIDIEATKVSEIMGISRPTINKIFMFIRHLIAIECEKESPFDEGEIELDESYFGAKRVRGKRGRGASGKIPVFGMLKRNGKVYTQVIKNCSLKEILPIIQTKISTEMLVFTDCFKTYDGLADFGYKQHFRIKHSENEFAHGENHINGIENFLGLCKVRLSRFRGVHKKQFFLHLKECEWRYNNRDKDCYHFILSLLRKNPINS